MDQVVHNKLSKQAFFSNCSTWKLLTLKQQPDATQLAGVVPA
jgi:hypothetical protein